MANNNILNMSLHPTSVIIVGWRDSIWERKTESKKKRPKERGGARKEGGGSGNEVKGEMLKMASVRQGQACCGAHAGNKGFTFCPTFRKVPWANSIIKFVCLDSVKREISLMRAETRRRLKSCCPAHICTVTEHMIGVWSGEKRERQSYKNVFILTFTSSRMWS